MNTESTQKQISALRVKLNFLLALFILSTILSVYLLTKSDDREDILYAKGIVIQDQEGNDRILIGAPIPKSKDRIRDDIEKAKSVWGSENELELDKEWDWFEELNHDCYGMLVLDENGHDRLALGSPTPDPNIGIRIGPATGLEINDEKGYERSGYSYMNMGESGRVVLGLDNPGSAEGAVFSLLENGEAGIKVFDRKSNSTMFFGKVGDKDQSEPNEESSLKIIIKDSTGTTNITKRK